jgi:hypothetical protein
MKRQRERRGHARRIEARLAKQARAASRRAVVVQSAAFEAWLRAL